MYTASDADGTDQMIISGAGILIEKTVNKENTGRGENDRIHDQGNISRRIQEEP